jgi:hypothetical protein
MRLLLANLEKIVSFKKLMKSLVDTDCASLIQNISHLLERLKDKDEYEMEIVELLRFCKKLGKQEKLHENIVEFGLQKLALEYIG